jgi:hypothetical protein
MLLIDILAASLKFGSQSSDFQGRIGWVDLAVVCERLMVYGPRFLVIYRLILVEKV